jgi:hypothetical protein
MVVPMARPPVPLALLVVVITACASTGAMTPAEHDAPYLKERASEACSGADVAACCRQLEQELGSAREREDTAAADEIVERMALACPEQRRGALDPRADRGPGSRAERSMLSLSFQIRLAPEDRLYWASAYLDGKARTQYAAPGAHEIAVEMHVVSGTGPSRGKLFKLQQAQPLEAKARSWVGAMVKLARVEGGEPFRLEVTTTNDPGTGMYPGISGGGVVGGVEGGVEAPVKPAAKDAGAGGTAGGVVGGVVGGVLPGVTTKREGTIGLGNLSRVSGPKIPRHSRPQRREEPPPLYVPSELVLAGAPRAWFSNCVNAAGDIVVSALSSRMQRPLHPRLMGAVLDWLRRFEYETPDWDPETTAVCEELAVRFDRSPFPTPKPGGPLEARFRYDQ